MINVSSNNVCLAAPGLAIVTAASTVKYGNTFSFKANGRVSASITTATAPSLALATLQKPYPSGTASTAGVLATDKYRIYTLIGTLPTPTPGSSAVATATATFSWLASADYDATADLPNIQLAAMPDQSNQTAVGFVIIQNESGSDFTPGVTVLTAVTVTYIDNYGIMGNA